MNLLRKIIICLGCLLLVSACASGSCRAAVEHSRELSALAVFQALPFQILDRLPIPMSDADRAQLARHGYADPWQIWQSTRNLLEIRAIGSDQVLRLCLYRGRTGLVAVLALDLGALCASELWLIDNDNLAVPLAPPGQPLAHEYFELPEDLAGDIRASTTYCPHPQGLEARPLFWSLAGNQDLDPDYSIFYYWNGRYFSKRLIDLRNQEAGD